MKVEERRKEKSNVKTESTNGRNGRSEVCKIVIAVIVGIIVGSLGFWIITSFAGVPSITNTSDVELATGIYIVGKDTPAGEYTLQSTSVSTTGMQMASNIAVYDGNDKKAQFFQYFEKDASKKIKLSEGQKVKVTGELKGIVEIE